jgi:long-chain acyl-CoA synthetase
MSNPYSEKPWLKFYDEHVPPSLEYPEKTYPQIYWKATADIPSRVAVYYMGRGITYGELDGYANKFAHFLKQSGLKPGDTVGVNLPNIPAYYIALVGIQKSGCVLSGVSPLLQPDELEYQLNDSGVKLLVTLDVLFSKVEAIVNKTDVKTVAVAEIADFLPSLKKWLGKLLKKIPTGKINPISGIKVGRFMDFLGGMPSETVEENLDVDAPCLMQYTGGTTGPSKGAVLTHRNIVSQITQVNTWMDLKNEEHATVLSAFPLFHLAGLFLGMNTLAIGATQVAVPDPRDLDFIISAIGKYKPKAIINVPTIFLELLKRPKFRSLDFSGVEWFMSAAAPFPPEYIKEFETLVGEGKLIELLGMTETSPVHTSLPRYGQKKPGSEIVASAIVLKSGVEKGEVMKKMITKFMRQKVAPYKVPKVIQFMDELPTSAIGKVLKRELRDKIIIS